jgi:hypothetical protein
MRLREVLDSQNFATMLMDMVEPSTAKPPPEKGADAILVRGYVVHGFWRKRWHPYAPKRHKRYMPKREKRERWSGEA